VSLDERVEQLERRRRADRAWTALGVVIGLGVLAIGALVLWNKGEVRTRQLSIVDERGRVRAELRPLTGGAYGLVFRDAEGHPRALLETEANGSPRLSFANPSGQRLADLTVFGDAPRLELATADGSSFFAVSLQMDGSSRLEISDRTRARAVLGASDDGSPALALVDSKGRVRAALSIIGDSPSLMLEGSDGNVFKAPVE
jgi:hypothetical protein